MAALGMLKSPFSPGKISWRVGSTTADKKKGMALAYIDARDVMERLDEACGNDGWQDRYEVHGTKTICYLSIKMGGEWITKADGAGDTDVEAEKGSLSDSFKRAAVKWGIGRYLYDIESPWVELDTKEVNGKVYVKGIAKHEFARLERLLPGAQIPSAPAEERPDAAQVYVEAALHIIKNFKGTKAELRDWWNSEGPARRDNILSQTHIDILRGKLTERADELEKEAA